MTQHRDLLLTAIAPLIWGSTYIVTTELLPQGYPLAVATLRALPAGLLLLLLVRTLPRGDWWWRVFVLGALNFSVFWSMLFVSAYRLPGGVAATLGAVQPLIVIFLARAVLGSSIRAIAVLSALAGIVGVALLVLTPSAALDVVGIGAGIAGAASMALGTVLTRRWKPPVSLLTATAWQLTAGGILLLPVAFVFEPGLPSLSLKNLAGFAYLAVPGAALTYLLWFRGLSRLEPSIVASLALLSPVAAVLLGWVLLGQTLTTPQLIGIAVVAASVYFSQHARPTSRHLRSDPVGKARGLGAR